MQLEFSKTVFSSFFRVLRIYTKQKQKQIKNRKTFCSNTFLKVKDITRSFIFVLIRKKQDVN